VPYAKVKSKTRGGEEPDAGKKPWPKAKIRVAFALQIAANTFHQGTTGERAEFGTGRFTFLQRRVGDDSFQARFVVCERASPAHFGKATGPLATALDEDYFAHVRIRAGRREIRRKKTPDSAPATHRAMDTEAAPDSTNGHGNQRWSTHSWLNRALNRNSLRVPAASDKRRRSPDRDE